MTFYDVDMTPREQWIDFNSQLSGDWTDVSLKVLNTVTIHYNVQPNKIANNSRFACVLDIGKELYSYSW